MRNSVYFFPFLGYNIEQEYIRKEFLHFYYRKRVKKPKEFYEKNFRVSLGIYRPHLRVFYRGYVYARERIDGRGEFARCEQ